MSSKPVIEHIASIATAIKTCRARAEQPLGGDAERWANRHNAALGDLLENTLPHGSGFDSGVSIDWEASDTDAERYVFVCPFHVMNETGFYVGWAEYRVTVTPSFIGRISLEIERTETTGDDAECDLEDFIGETMFDALTAEFTIPASFYGDA